MTSAPQQAIILVTGIQAAGKSTIAQMLAERLPRSVHVRGVRNSGRVEPAVGHSPRIDRSPTPR
jgi:hypothetical protein